MKRRSGWIVIEQWYPNTETSKFYRLRRAGPFVTREEAESARQSVAPEHDGEIFVTPYTKLVPEKLVRKRLQSGRRQSHR